jgi:hypothetical protein
MGQHFKPLDKQEAERIRAAIKGGRAVDSGIAIDRETGECVGAQKVRNASPDKVNILGRHGTHYSLASILPTDLAGNPVKTGKER